MAIITIEGKAWDALMVQGNAPASNAKMQYGTWGTGAQTEATVGAATYGNAFGSFTESGEARSLGTLSNPVNGTDRLVYTITATASRTITQTARTNVLTVGASGQLMLEYAAFTGLALNTGDQITFTVDQLFS
jgi:hypothetical protein